MPPKTTILATQIQRMMLSEAEKKRLLNELQTLDKKGIQELAELIRQHDDEALKILNKKVEEDSALREAIVEMGQKPVPLTLEEGRIEIGHIREIFSDPKKLAYFLALSDEILLAQLEKIILSVLKKDSEPYRKFERFFREARLQKAAFVKKTQQQEKAEGERHLENRRQQERKLDAWIAKAEKVLQKNK